MTSPTPLTIEAGLLAEQDLLAHVCTGESEFGLLFWQPTDRALVMPRRLNRLPLFRRRVRNICCRRLAGTAA